MSDENVQQDEQAQKARQKRDEVVEVVRPDNGDDVRQALKRQWPGHDWERR